MAVSDRSYRAALFGSQILDLGQDWLADWLVRSFWTGDGTPMPGWFHYEEDEHFGPVFSALANEFTPEERMVVRSALDIVFSEISVVDGCYVGLFNLVRMAEPFAPPEMPRIVETILRTWLLGIGQHARRPPRYDAEVYLLREVLEVFYRLLDRSIDRPLSVSTGLQSLGKLAYDLLMREMISDEIIPSIAPLFHLARYEAAQRLGSEEDVSSLHSVAKSSFLTKKTAYPEFYIFHYEDHLYPYDFGRLCLSVD